MNLLRNFIHRFHVDMDVREHTILLCALVCVLTAFVGGLCIGMTIGYNKALQQKDTHASIRQ